MAEKHAELIKALERELHGKRLEYEQLAEIDPNELPIEEVPRYTAEYEAALAEWRRACLFLNTVRRSAFDAATMMALMTGREISLHAAD